MELSIPYLKSKWRDSGFQKYFRNTSWMLFGQASMVISLIVNIWLARYLGPTNYGTLSYVLAFGGIFGFIAGLGMNDVLVRELVRYPEKRDKLLGSAFGLLSVTGVIAFLCVIGSAFLFEPTGLVRTLIILYGTVFLFSPTSAILAYFQATVQGRRNAIVQISSVLAVACVKVALILLHKGIVWLIFAFILDIVVGSIMYIVNYRASGLSMYQWTFDRNIAKALFIGSIFLMLSAVTSYFFLRIDQIMIRFYLGDTAVGFYAAAVKLSEIWYFIPGIICASIFPAIINAKKVSEELYKKRLWKLYAFLGGSALLIAVPITFLAPWLISILFGSTYATAAPILAIYIWSGIGLFLDTGLDRYFTTENRLLLVFLYNLLAATTNVILNIILIPRIGITGAAWATLISYSLYPIFAFTIHLRGLYTNAYVE